MWHELGHTYLAAVFARQQPAITRLAYLVQQDPRTAHWAAMRGGWSNFFNENVTQAVTNVLKLRAGFMTRGEAFEADEFYLYSGELAQLIEQQYPLQAPDKNFEAYFPALLRAFAAAHPRPAPK
ncbi:MAG: hypothetical protein ACRYG7_13560 [Janthinobacterium lividum]